MNLLIVESPNKCQKIRQILDKLYGLNSWEVKASVGHIRDLPQKSLGVDRAAGYRPSYEIAPDKKGVVQTLSRLVQQVGKSKVFLATDPDREGEAIAFHLATVLNLPIAETQRVTFSEITEKAIREAISSPRPIHTRLVAAQEARRIIDRLAGYEVSPLLSRKIGKALSAGRVQSVALRLVVLRERTIQNWKQTAQFRIKTTFLTPKGETLQAIRTATCDLETQARHYLNTLGQKRFVIENVDKKIVEQHPPAPFTTSTLQQEAIRKFTRQGERWTAKEVVDVAQQLFESGHITYMRTDSPNLSMEARQAVIERIRTELGTAYIQPRTFQAKASAQEAHEAIRPTDLDQPQAGQTARQQVLYDLIFRRTLASQMAPARREQIKLIINESRNPSPDDEHTSTAYTALFDGYKRVYSEAGADEEEESEEGGRISPVTPRDTLQTNQSEARQTYKKPPKRFDEASLVAELEKKGIGRPSTYAAILSGLSRRQYVETQNIAGTKVNALVLTWQQAGITPTTESLTLGTDKQKWVPSVTGTTVTDFLEHYFSPLVDTEFTGQMEAQLDQIALGKLGFKQVVTAFDEVHQQHLRQAETGQADAVKEQKTRIVGEYEGKMVRVGTQKDGRGYLLYDDQFYPLADVAPDDITIDHLPAAIRQKEKAREQTRLDLVHEVNTGKKTYQIRKGQYGLYVTDGNRKAPVKELDEDVIRQWTAADCTSRFDEYEKWKKQKEGFARPKKGSSSKNKK